MSVLAPAGIIGSIVNGILGAPLKDAAGLALSAVNGWIVAGAEAMLREVISVISLVTTPSLSNSWFSVHYWQVAALAMLLTVPFLFAAAVQAILRSDLSLLLRAALFDLPIATVAVYAAAPLITLLLSATDEMCSLVSGGGPVGGSFLSGLPTDLSKAGSGFLIVVIAVVILFAGMVLLVELIVRSAAIYVVVLFLPMGFAAMIWPARRIWIKRMLEILIALILSKFAMVAILTLAITALASLSEHPTALTTALTAMALIVIATASPWALLRLLPFTELAASATLLMHGDTGGRVQGAAQMVGGAAAEMGAGALVDPIGDGASFLRNYASSGNDPNSDQRGGFRRAAMRVLGSGSAGLGELPPAAGGGSNPPSGGGTPQPAGPAGPPPDGPSPAANGIGASITSVAGGMPAPGAPAPRPSGDPDRPGHDSAAGLGIVGGGAPLSGGPTRLADSRSTAPPPGEPEPRLPVEAEDPFWNHEELKLELGLHRRGWLASAEPSDPDDDAAGGEERT
jgi:hypothetical protein